MRIFHLLFACSLIFVLSCTDETVDPCDASIDLASHSLSEEALRFYHPYERTQLVFFADGEGNTWKLKVSKRLLNGDGQFITFGRAVPCESDPSQITTGYISYEYRNPSLKDELTGQEFKIYMSGIPYYENRLLKDIVGEEIKVSYKEGGSTTSHRLLHHIISKSSDLGPEINAYTRMDDEVILHDQVFNNVISQEPQIPGDEFRLSYTAKDGIVVIEDVRNQKKWALVGRL